ncbi:MAG: hypothetical protein ACOZNI_19060 [Myxococcota bacterium]
MDEGLRERAERRRRTWRASVGRSHRAVQADESTLEERVSQLWTVSETAWAMSGRPFPTYSREQMPGRLVRG